MDFGELYGTTAMRILAIMLDVDVDVMLMMVMVVMLVACLYVVTETSESIKLVCDCGPARTHLWE